MSVDPLADQFAGVNPYHYVHNNPIMLIDPTGMAADSLGPVAAKLDQGAADVRDIIADGLKLPGKIKNKISDISDKILAKIDGFVGNTDHSASNPEGQQHNGVNQTIYGEGSQYGFELPGDYPDRNGANEVLDIAEGLPGGGFMKGPIMKASGLRRTNELLKTAGRLKSSGIITENMRPNIGVDTTIVGGVSYLRKTISSSPGDTIFSIKPLKR